MNECVKCGVSFSAPSELKEYCPSCWRERRINYCKSAYLKRAYRKRLNDFYPVFYSGFKKYVRSKKFGY